MIESSGNKNTRWLLLICIDKNENVICGTFSLLQKHFYLNQRRLFCFIFKVASQYGLVVIK